MKAVQIRHFRSPAEVVDLPDAVELGFDEVEVRIDLSPINPADILQLEGRYGSANPPLPLIPGAEAVGTVTAAGRGVTDCAVGDRVLVLRSLVGTGVWRQRVVAKTASLVNLPHTVDIRQLANLGINAPTAWLLLHSAPVSAGGWIIQNAANSSVGQMIISLAKIVGFKTINVVRRDGLAAELKALGADEVLVDGDDLAERVTVLAGEGGVSLAIDAVGGASTRRLAACVNEGGVIVNYGVLEGKPCEIEGGDLIFRGISLRGFWLRNWFVDANPSDRAALYGRLAGYVADGRMKASIEQIYALPDVAAAVVHAARCRRAGKILLSFT